MEIIVVFTQAFGKIIVFISKNNGKNKYTKHVLILCNFIKSTKNLILLKKNIYIYTIDSAQCINGNTKYSSSRSK